MHDPTTERLTASERRSRMLARCLFSPRFPTLDAWMDEFDVSRPSVVSDVQAVREWLAARRLGLVGKPGVGYELVYDEADLRRAWVDYVLEVRRPVIQQLFLPRFGQAPALACTAADVFPAEPGLRVQEFCFGPTEAFLDLLEQETFSRLTVRSRVRFLLHLAVMVQRLRTGHVLAPHSARIEAVVSASEYRLVDAHCCRLEEAYGLDLPPGERAFIALEFIGAKKMYDQATDSDEELSARAEAYARRLAAEAGIEFSLPLADDNEFISLLTKHVMAVLRSLHLGVALETPSTLYPDALVGQVREEHPLSWGVAQRFCGWMDEAGIGAVTETTAAYIAMHIAAGVERARHRLQRRKRVALVCPTALSASTLLYWKMQNLFPDIDVVQVGSYDDVETGRIVGGIDLVVTTVDLPGATVPTVRISPLFTAVDRERVAQALHPHKLGEDVRLDLLAADAIFVGESWPDAESMLQGLGERLAACGYASTSYPAALLERHRRFGSALATPVPLALPHAGPEQTVTPVVAVATLQEPVPFPLFEDRSQTLPVRLVLMPLLQPSDELGMTFHRLLSALQQRRLARRLLACAGPDDVLRLLRHSAAVPKTQQWSG